MAKPKGEKRKQLSIGLEEPLRKQIEVAAQVSVRSLSGEINKRLRDSFAEQPDAALPIDRRPRRLATEKATR